MTKHDVMPVAVPEPDAEQGLDLFAGEVALPSTGPEASSFLSVLRLRDFRLLWIAQSLTQLADKMLVFTLLVVVFEITGRSATQSFVMLAYTLPSIVLSAPAGVFVDRHSKRTLMLVTNVVRGLIVLVIPLSLGAPLLAGQAWPLITLIVAFSAVGQLFAPAEAASIPFLVSRPQIVVATSLFMTTVVGTLIAGVPLATLCLRVLGREAPFIVAAGLFLLGGFFCALLRPPLVAARSTHAAPHVLGELAEGLRVIGGRPALRTSIIQLALALITVVTMFALGPAYISRVLGRNPDDTYQLLIPATGGIILTAVLLGRRGARVRRSRAVVRAALGCGALFVVAGTVPQPVLASGHEGWLTPLVLAVGIGFGLTLGTLLILAFTAVQEGTDEHTRGRIFGGVFTVINAASAVPLLLAGTLADTIGVDRVVTGIGILLVIYGALLAGPGRHALRRMDHA